MSKEVRNVELRAVASDDGKMVLEGYAIVFNTETQIGNDDWGFREIVMPTALENADMKDVPLKYNHNDAVPILARTRNRSLQLVVDEIGLKIRAELLDTSDARDMYKRIEAGLLDKMSFAFTVRKVTWIEEEGKLPLRQIDAIERLYDVSIVDVPAYDDTTISARRKDYGYKEHCPADIMTIIDKYVII